MFLNAPLPAWRLVLSAAFLLPAASLAQRNSTPYDKTSYWFSYFTDVSVTPRAALHFDTSFRSIDDTTWRQLVFRPGVNLKLNQQWDLSLTYGYFKSNPNGLSVDTYAVPEHRLHQQFTYRHGMGRLGARHRIRNEQRWIGTEYLGESFPRDYRFQERLRYLFRTDVPLRRGSAERPSLYLSFYDEVGFRFGFRGTSYFDQNRLYGGVGYRPNSSTTIEFGAFGQRFKPLSGGRFENNVMVLLSVTNTFK